MKIVEILFICSIAVNCYSVKVMRSYSTIKQEQLELTNRLRKSIEKLEEPLPHSPNFVDEHSEIEINPKILNKKEVELFKGFLSERKMKYYRKDVEPVLIIGYNDSYFFIVEENKAALYKCESSSEPRFDYKHRSTIGHFYRSERLKKDGTIEYSFHLEYQSPYSRSSTESCFDVVRVSDFINLAE